jgi:two-component system, NarL family, response regulator LiaR
VNLDPVRIRIVDAPELVAAGLKAVLKRAEGCVVVDTSGDPPAADIVLYGLSQAGGGHTLSCTRWCVARWPCSFLAGIPTQSRRCSPLACGAQGFASLKLTGDQMARAIIEAHRDRTVARVLPDAAHCHPGVERANLTPRETNVLALIGDGLTNQKIADRLHLAINTVKTYIGTNYRKIGVSRRSHAVIWVQQHGLQLKHDEVSVDESPLEIG